MVCIKILFPFYTCSVHVLTMMQVQTPASKTVGIFVETDYATDLARMSQLLKGTLLHVHTAITIWIKILFLLCTYLMHVLTVLQVSNLCIKNCRRIGRDKNSTTYKVTYRPTDIWTRAKLKAKSGEKFGCCCCYFAK